MTLRVPHVFPGKKPVPKPFSPGKNWRRRRPIASALAITLRLQMAKAHTQRAMRQVMWTAGFTEDRVVRCKVVSGEQRAGQPALVGDDINTRVGEHAHEDWRT